MKYALAVDIGASSGRHIVGWEENGEIRTEEVYRFPNGMERQDGHLVWDTEKLTAHVKAGIAAARAKYPKIASLSVDTWGVDYVLLHGAAPLLPCYAYRDSRTESAVRSVHEHVPFEKLYAATGIQFQPFNTVYQMAADQAAGRLEAADDFLMMPEYLLWRLCGVKAHEYTIASTGGLLNARTGAYDTALIDALGLPKKIFPARMQHPGTAIGTYEGIRCMLCAAHDTASAVEGIQPGTDEIYLSSGTWSLLGAKLLRPITTDAARAGNWTNEGGPGYVRFLKNIMGMWIVNRLRAELCPELPFDAIVCAAEKSVYPGLIDVNASALLSPESMRDAVAELLAAGGYRLPEETGGWFRCVYRSMAKCYGAAVRELRNVTGRTYRRLVIAGGGAKNGFLNRLTAEEAGIPVTALPIEATAIGNLRVQLDALKKETL